MKICNLFVRTMSNASITSIKSTPTTKPSYFSLNWKTTSYIKGDNKPNVDHYKNNLVKIRSPSLSNSSHLSRKSVLSASSNHSQREDIINRSNRGINSMPSSRQSLNIANSCSSSSISLESRKITTPPSATQPVKRRWFDVIWRWIKSIFYRRS